MKMKPKTYLLVTQVLQGSNIIEVDILGIKANSYKEAIVKVKNFPDFETNSIGVTDPEDFGVNSVFSFFTKQGEGIFLSVYSYLDKKPLEVL